MWWDHDQDVLGALCFDQTTNLSDLAGALEGTISVLICYAKNHRCRKAAIVLSLLLLCVM